jgi:hypothetical protein
MRNIGMRVAVVGVAASLVLGACSSGPEASSTAVATTGSSVAVSTVPPVHAGNSVVSVAPAASTNPHTRAVAALLTRRYTDINERNFDDYWKMLTPQYGATFNRAEVAAGYRSTDIFDIRLTELRTGEDGRLAATVTFTSNQDAADGPSGQVCTRWTVGFFLTTSGGTYLIDKPPSSYHAKHTAC